MTAWQDYKYEAAVNRIHDGDTIFVNVDLGFRLTVNDMPIRFYGINAPELATADGKTALAYLETLIKPADPVNVQTFKDPLDKYGRWLATIFRQSDGLCLNDAMLNSGHAVVYKP